MTQRAPVRSVASRRRREQDAKDAEAGALVFFRAAEEIGQITAGSRGRRSSGARTAAAGSRRRGRRGAEQRSQQAIVEKLTTVACRDGWAGRGEVQRELRRESVMQD